MPATDKQLDECTRVPSRFRPGRGVLSSGGKQAKDAAGGSVVVVAEDGSRVVWTEVKYEAVRQDDAEARIAGFLSAGVESLPVVEL